MTRAQTQAPDWMVRWTAPQGAAMGSLGCVLALLGTLPATGVMEAILVGAAVVLGGATSWFVVRRKQLDSLPLMLAPVALVEEVDGFRTLKVRAWLGLGRVMRQPSLSVSWTSPTGSTRMFQGVFPADVLCGPVTVLVSLPIDVTGGQFDVDFEVQEGERHWRQQASYPAEALQRGQFGVPLVCQRGRWRWKRSSWDTIEAPVPAKKKA